MRRLCIYLVCMLCLLMSGSDGGYQFALRDIDMDGVYSCYTSEMVGDIPSECSVTRYGNGYIISCDNGDISSIVPLITGTIYGESIAITGTRDDYDRLVAGMVGDEVRREQYLDMECVYGYGDYGKCVYIYDGKVNIQMVYTDGTIVIGCPIILGSY